MNINNNFIVDSNGNLTAKGNASFTGTINSQVGNIGGWEIGLSGLYNSTVKIQNDGVTNIYTWADLAVIQMIIMNQVTLDSWDVIQHYDMNGDGQISSIDYVMLKNRLIELLT